MVIPAEEPQVNRSPLLLSGPSLGIESWCLLPLFRYVSAKLMRLQRNVCDELNDVTRVLLLLNPEYATAWNTRSVHLLAP